MNKYIENECHWTFFYHLVWQSVITEKEHKSISLGITNNSVWIKFLTHLILSLRSPNVSCEAKIWLKQWNDVRQKYWIYVDAWHWNQIESTRYDWCWINVGFSTTTDAEATLIQPSSKKSVCSYILADSKLKQC